MLVGKPPSLTATQAYFCAVMGERRRDGESVPRIGELAVKFGCSKATITNSAWRRYTKHHEYGERA